MKVTLLVLVSPSAPSQNPQYSSILNADKSPPVINKHFAQYILFMSGVLVLVGNVLVLMSSVLVLVGSVLDPMSGVPVLMSGVLLQWLALLSHSCFVGDLIPSFTLCGVCMFFSCLNCP